MSDLPTHSALDLATLVRDRAVSAVELLAHFEGRIDALDGDLGAFVQRLPAAARREALAVDRATDRSAPLLGVPFAIKDTDPVRFAWNRAGSRAYRYVWSPFDADQVARLRRAGVVILGKTATSELALMPVVETDLGPPARNPWNPAFSSGGSSGGAATAVAAGMLPVAHAADGAGSIRVPAALCHLFGYKASRGQMPDFYAAMDRFRLSVVGCVSHTVADSAAVADVLAGRRDGLSGALSRAPTGLRIGLCTTTPLTTVHPDIVAGLEGLARTLQELGHHVEPLEALPGDLDEFLPIYGFQANRAPVLSEASLQPVTRWLRGHGRGRKLAAVQAQVDALARRIQVWHGGFDLLLTPTAPRFAPRVGEFVGDDPAAVFEAAAALGAFTAPCNLSGQPAASLPGGLGGPDALPWGAQLIGRVGEDAQLLAVCRQLEQAAPWLGRRPRQDASGAAAQADALPRP